MKGIVMLGGYGEKSGQTVLATPRASTRVNVYGLSVDVFVFQNNPYQQSGAW